MPEIHWLDGSTAPLGTIFCIGRNYAAHIAELGNDKPAAPVLFDKPASALLHDGGVIRLPEGSDDVHYETEIVAVLGRGGRNISLADAEAMVAGYAVGLDLTARDWQQEAKAKGLPWTLAKGFDGAACVSAFIPSDQCPAASDMHFSMHLNGQLRQYGNSAMMLFPIAEQIAFISRHITLHAGDLIFTGTPQGVGKLTCGDKLDLDLLGKVQAHFQVE